MHQGTFRSHYFLTMMLIFQILAHKNSFCSFFNLKPFLTSTSPAFLGLNYEKQYKEGTCKFSGRSVVFSAFYADSCLCPKSVIITILNTVFFMLHKYFIL